MSCPDVQDANLILRLYELRRESVLREAREWMMTRFRAGTVDELSKVCPIGSDNHRMFRMVLSYWDMVGAFVNNGVLNPDLFFQTTGEHLNVWFKVEPWVEKLRESYKLPFMMKNLQDLATKHLAWLDARHPGSSEAMRANFRKMQEAAAASR